MAKFILNLHQNNMEEPPIGTILLRKYLSYARQNIFPKLSDSAVEDLKDYYIKISAYASSKGVKAVPISARQLEALVRL